jgi:hypothetical protein
VTEPLLLTTTRIRTFDGQQLLTAASGFLFSRARKIFLITSRHVLLDRESGHSPNRIEIELHNDPSDLTRTSVISIWLYEAGHSRWRQGGDGGGSIDVAAIELDRASLPAAQGWRCFTPEHLQGRLDEIQVGRPLLIVGFPLGFYDTVHHLPVVRHAIIASSFGVRFQAQGYFLTDARTHRGSSGAPVVLHDPEGDPQLPWKLLGIHASGMDMKTRDRRQDESLGLNSAWYADILLTLTDDTAMPRPGGHRREST